MLRAQLFHGNPCFVEDQPLEVIGQISQSQFCFSMCQSDGADKQAEAAPLSGKNMLDHSILMKVYGTAVFCINMPFLPTAKRKHQ